MRFGHLLGPDRSEPDDDHPLTGGPLPLTDWIDAGAKGTFVADCRITPNARPPWLSDWMKALQAAKAAMAG